MKRRPLLHSILLTAFAATVLLLSACAGGPRGTSGGPPQELVFLQITDPQVGMYRAFKEAEGYEPELRDFRRAVEFVRREKPRFVIITGDLVEQWNDEQQLALFQQFVDDLSRHTTVHLAAGNHDMSFDPQGLAFYRARYGADRYLIDEGDTRLLVINSNLFAYPKELAAQEQEQFAWLETQLAAARAAGTEHLIVVHHHPLFLRDPGEPDEYFNIPSPVRRRYLDLYAAHGVDAVLTGHYHREAGGRYGDLQMIVTSSLGYPLGATPPGLRRVHVGPDGITHEYLALPPDAVSPPAPR